MGGKCFKSDDSPDDGLSIPLTSQSPPPSRKLSAPLLSRSDLDLAETRIKCQILEKQSQDEHHRLHTLLTDLKSVNEGNSSAREAIREINAKIQQLELKAVSLRPNPARSQSDEFERKKNEARTKQREKELLSSKSRLADINRDKETISARLSSVKAAIAAGEHTIKDMESSIQKPVTIPSMKKHYVRGVVLQLRKWQLGCELRAFERWRTAGKQGR